MAQKKTITLRLTDTGRWAIRSTSASVIYLDLDAQTLLRVQGHGSPPWAYDGRWVQLVAVETAEGPVDQVTVGVRHLYLTDPEPGGADFQWWAPRTCTSIEDADHEDLPPVPGGRHG